MADTHRPSKSPTIPTDGSFPYWTTVCGKRLDGASLAISDTAANVTCAICKAGAKRGSKR
jgi:hypothetical protein